MSKRAAHRPPAWLLYALIGTMTLLWTVNFIIAKFALNEIPPLLVMGCRTTLAGLLILPAYLASRQDVRGSWTLRNVPELLGIGALGVTANQLFFVIGLSRTTVAHPSLIIGLTPVLVLLLAWISGLETLRPAKLLGLGVALTGVAVLQFGAVRKGEATFIGDFFVFLASVTFALFTVYTKRVAHHYGAILINTFAYVGGALMLAPVVLWLAPDFNVVAVGWKAWASVLYMAVFPSLLCYLIYSYALRYVAASRLSAFSYLQPLVATLLAIPMLGERPGASVFGGGALVLTGVVLAERA